MGTAGSGGESGAGAERDPGGSGAAPSIAARVSAAEFLDLASVNNGVGSAMALYRKIENLDGESLRRLAEDLDRLPSTDSRQWQARNTLLARYAEVDPEGAFGYAGSIKNQNLKRAAMGSVIGSIAGKDLQKAIALARGVEDTADFQQLVNTLAMANTSGTPEAVLQLSKERGGIGIEWGYNQMFANWYRQDPQSAIANLADLPPGRARGYALDGIASGMAGVAADAGLEWAMGLTNSTERSKMVSTMIGNVAATDPQRAVALLESHGQPMQRQQMLQSIAQNWTNSDPEAAKQWIGSLPENDRSAALQGSIYQLADDAPWCAEQLANLPPNSRTTNLASSLAQVWAARDPEATAAWVSTLPDSQMQRNARQNLVNQWAQKDPAAAAAFLSTESLVGKGDEHLAGNIAGQWITTDPSAAIAWMDGIELSKEARSNMIRNAVGTWSQSDAPAAADYVLGLEGDERKNAVQSLMGGWGQQDFERAQAWVAEIGDAGTRNTALNALISNSASLAPERAATILTEAFNGLSGAEGEETFAPAAQNIASSWSQFDPVGAARWAVDLPESAGRPAVFQSIVGQWAEFEPKAASEWLQSFGPGPDRDGAVEGLVSRIVREDPESAFLWAATVDDPEKQKRLANQAVSQWGQSDPEAARATINSANLDEALRQDLLEQIKE